MKKKEKNKFNELSEELLIDLDIKNDYEQYLEERKALLPLTKDEREKIEKIIKLEVLKIFKQAKIDAQSDDLDKGFFKYKPFLEIPYLKEYFNIFTSVGDRNIGKSTSSKIEVRNVVSTGRRFMWFRNIDDEVEAQLASDTAQEGWLTKNGWSYTGKAKSPNIVDLQGNEIGFYRPINTSSKFKSVDFPDVDLIVYEEFPEGNVQNKYYKFVKMMSTVMRQNINGWALLQSNYTDQSDDIMMGLGVGAKKLTKEDFIFLNWEIGAVVIFIPKNIYRKPQDVRKDLAYRASMGNFDVWKSQFGGGFANEEPINIINEKTFSAIVPIFNIYNVNATGLGDKSKQYGAFKMTLYHVWDEEGKMHNVLTKTKGENNKPIFIFDYLNKILYPHAILMEIETLDNLIYEWNINNLKTTSLDVHGSITALFAKAKQMLSKEDENITDIENIMI